ncbi:MAG: amidohydrolase/deacetylase family metallohydrolase [Bryobacterales bacterium]|nr:amidohydrolase/deacetylase family metallohydrolase [Bryobacterales bacterium]
MACHIHHWAAILLAPLLSAQVRYDLLLKHGHVIDAKSGLSAVRDIAIANGRIAAIAEDIPAESAVKVVDVRSLYVTPGLVDIHTHVMTMSGLRGSLVEDQNVWADSHTFRAGVTTVVDAGSSGWRTFEEQKRRIIDHSRTRILAMLNIVGAGQGGGASEQDTGDMDPKATAAMAKRYPGLVVGIKTAHYRGPEWTAVERAVEAGRLADVPVMVDFGDFRPERPYEELVTKKLRPGDISTHMYLGRVPMLDENGKLRAYLREARRRGVIFDVGHGGGSFLFRQAVPAIEQGFPPDSISTDLHTESMNAGMKDMLNVASKILNIGMPLDDVIARVTWNPAREIKRTDLGHLEVGAVADVAVLRVEQGNFGFVDSYGARMNGNKLLVCELTIHDGLVVWDLNGLTREDWRGLGKYDKMQDRRWDSTYGPLSKKQK